MKYRKKPIVVEATQWFKNGDHPQDNIFRPFEDTGKIPIEPREGEVVRYYRTPELDGQNNCEKCGNIMHLHGWIDTIDTFLTSLNRPMKKFELTVSQRSVGPRLIEK